MGNKNNRTVSITGRIDSAKYIEILSGSLLFSGLEKSEIAQVIHCLAPQIHTYRRNDFIALAGDQFDSIGIVCEGKAAVIRENAAGDRIVMTYLKSGDMFGEMGIFSDRSVWPASVQAQEACSVFFLPGEKIIGQCGKTCVWHRALIKNMLKILTEKALILNKKVEYLTIKSMRRKISTFLLEQFNRTGKSTFMLPLNRSELADFLNVSRPSMSREMSHMRDEGIIDYHLSSVKILDINALKAQCEGTV